jgi:hypothetical protein
MKKGAAGRKKLRELFFRLSVKAAGYREFPVLFYRSVPLLELGRLFLHAEGCGG